MNEETISIAIEVLLDLYVYEESRSVRNYEQLNHIGQTLDQLRAIKRIWLS